MQRGRPGLWSTCSSECARCSTTRTNRHEPSVQQACLGELFVWHTSLLVSGPQNCTLLHVELVRHRRASLLSGGRSSAWKAARLEGMLQGDPAKHWYSFPAYITPFAISGADVGIFGMQLEVLHAASALLDSFPTEIRWDPATCAGSTRLNASRSCLRWPPQSCPK